MKIGYALPEFRIDFVDPEGMKVWAKALHDPNPIHLDVDAVKAAGLGDRRINQGPANLAYMINMLLAAFPDAQITNIDVRYMNNVLEGDAIVAGGVVKEVDGDTIDCDIWLDAAGRGRVIAGTAKLLSTR